MLAVLTLESSEKLATILGVAVAAAGLIVAAVQLRANANAARATFWLNLREQFAIHDEVHHNLRFGAPWHGSDAPLTRAELSKIEAYMGLLEHCECMLQQKLIDLMTFRDIYGYRVKNICSNSFIVRTKLVENTDGWKNFLALVYRIGYWNELCERIGVLGLLPLFMEHVRELRKNGALRQVPLGVRHVGKVACRREL